ncbi:MAG: hypothetical protein RBR78_10740 [Flavobacteriaceae bacterium]|jgi:hypothetical protein|nr:hypothetical protein [Flavobacteriaceae bacterium]
MIVCHNGAVYSLKVDDYAKLNVKIENDLATAKGSNDEEKEDFIEKRLAREYRKDKNNLERAFLKEFGNYGISIYKATDENLTNWKKLKLKNNTVEETICN